MRLKRKGHVALEKRQYPLNNQATTYDRVDQYVFVAWFGSDIPRIEHIPGEFKQSASHLVLVDEKFRLYQEPKSKRFMLLDRKAKTAFAFDQTR